MIRSLKIAMVALVLVASSVSLIHARGGSGCGGGGSVKPVTVRLAGYITAMRPVVGGVQVTLGTSYYATGTVLVNSSTKIRVNGVGDASVNDLRLNDFAEVDMIVVSKIAAKLEAVGAR